MPCMQYRQIHHRFPFPTQTIPAKAGISQCRACNIAKSTADSHSPHRPFLRRQESHSHVRQQCQIRPHNPVPTQTIPAKAGISQPCATTMPNPPTHSRSPTDHSCEGRNLTTMCNNNAKSAHTLPFPHRPFLRRQESHNHVRQQCQIRPHTPVPPQTIPAKAGISQPCAANGGVS